MQGQLRLPKYRCAIGSGLKSATAPKSSQCTLFILEAFCYSLSGDAWGWGSQIPTWFQFSDVLETNENAVEIPNHSSQVYCLIIFFLKGRRKILYGDLTWLDVKLSKWLLDLFSLGKAIHITDLQKWHFDPFSAHYPYLQLNEWPRPRWSCSRNLLS